MGLFKESKSWPFICATLKFKPFLFRSLIWEAKFEFFLPYPNKSLTKQELFRESNLAALNKCYKMETSRVHFAPAQERPPASQSPARHQLSSREVYSSGI